MTAWAEVLQDGTVGREEPLGMPRGLEPLHASLPLTGGLVGVLRSIIEIAVLAMFYSWENLLLSCSGWCGRSGFHRITPRDQTHSEGHTNP